MAMAAGNTMLGNWDGEKGRFPLFRFRFVDLKTYRTSKNRVRNDISRSIIVKLFLCNLGTPILFKLVLSPVLCTGI